MSVVVVSWVWMLLALFAVSFHAETRLEIRQARMALEQVRSRELARSAVELAEALLVTTGDNVWDAPAEGWDANPALRRVALEGGWMSLGHTTQGPRPRTVYGIEDDGRRLPWVWASDSMLARLPGIQPATLRELAVLRTLPPAAWPAVLERLPPAQRQRLEEYVTFAPDAAVNINTAPAVVLRALEIDAADVQRLIAHRNGADGRPGTPDDTPFTSLLLPSGGLDACRLDPAAAARISVLAREGWLDVVSTRFRVRARGWVREGAGYHEIVALLERLPEGGLAVLDWQEAWIP